MFSPRAESLRLVFKKVSVTSGEVFFWKNTQINETKLIINYMVQTENMKQQAI